MLEYEKVNIPDSYELIYVYNDVEEESKLNIITKILNYNYFYFIKNICTNFFNSELLYRLSVWYIHLLAGCLLAHVYDIEKYVNTLDYVNSVVNVLSYGTSLYCLGSSEHAVDTLCFLIPYIVGGVLSYIVKHTVIYDSTSELTTIISVAVVLLLNMYHITVCRRYKRTVIRYLCWGLVSLYTVCRNYTDTQLQVWLVYALLYSFYSSDTIFSRIVKNCCLGVFVQDIAMYSFSSIFT